MPDTQRQILIQPRIAAVADQVHAKRRRGTIGVPAIMRGQRFADLAQPFIELTCRASVERGKCADHPAGALGDDQFHARCNKHRGGDEWCAQAGPPRPQQRCAIPVRAGFEHCQNPRKSQEICGKYAAARPAYTARSVAQADASFYRMRSRHCNHSRDCPLGAARDRRDKRAKAKCR